MSSFTRYGTVALAGFILLFSLARFHQEGWGKVP
jgi:hypothetical protein